METRRLEYFVVLTSERHFGKAATRLHISQSALSQQILRLESDLGTQLIDRSAGNFELTPAGERVLRQSRAILEGMEELAGVSVDARAGLFGRVRIGVPHSMLFGQVPAVVNRYRGEHPTVEVDLRIEPTPDLHEMLRLAQIEVCLSYTAPAVDELHVREIYRDNYVVVLQAGHPLAAASSVELSQLKNERLLLTPRRNAPEAYDAIIGACIRSGFSAHDFSIEGTSYIDHVGLVAAGMGISLLPHRLQRDHYPDVRMVPLREPRLESHLLVSWNGRVTNLARDLFIDLVTEVLAGDERA